MKPNAREVLWGIRYNGDKKTAQLQRGRLLAAISFLEQTVNLLGSNR
jgi:hypothetical protein